MSNPVFLPVFWRARSICLTVVRLQRCIDATSLFWCPTTPRAGRLYRRAIPLNMQSEASSATNATLLHKCHTAESHAWYIAARLTGHGEQSAQKHGQSIHASSRACPPSARAQHSRAPHDHTCCSTSAALRRLCRSCCRSGSQPSCSPSSIYCAAHAMAFEHCSVFGLVSRCIEALSSQPFLLPMHIAQPTPRLVDIRHHFSASGLRWT